MASFPNYKPGVIPASQVEKFLKYMAGEIKVPVVSRPVTYKPKAK